MRTNRCGNVPWKITVNYIQHMKLHLTKGLFVALIAAVAPVMAEGTALDINSNGNALTGGPGDYNASAMTWNSEALKAGDTGKVYFGYNADWGTSGEYGVIVDESATVQALYFANTGSTFTKKGDGTLTIATSKTGDSGCGLASSFDVAGGTLVLAGENYAPLKTNVTTVGAGATLQLDAAQALGNGGTPTREHKILLQNGGTLSGAGSVKLEDAAIAAEGKGNIVSTTIKSGWDINFEVAADGELTLTGSLVKDGSEKVHKFGAGTLAIGSTALIDSSLALTIDEGALDLSDVATLSATSLTMGANTTLILGQTVDFTGSLTLGSGVTIDVSAWEGAPEEIFTSLSSFTATNPVTVDFGNGVTKQMMLTSVGGTVVVPEPTTATLSLLALAGLAARRRRK